MSAQISYRRPARHRKATLHPRIHLAVVRPCPINPPEHTTRICAEALATRLMAYWRNQGFPGAKFWVVVSRMLILDNEHGERYQRWDIRCNLVNGIPPEVES